MNIYTYYHPLGLLENQRQRKLLEFWFCDWKAQGWNPIILGENDANSHPYYHEFDREIAKINSTNPRAYERACLLRHLAMSNRGGGLLVDYDVFSLGLTEHYLPHTPGIAILGLGVPCAVLGSGAGFGMLCKAMAPYCRRFSSDMHIIQHLKVPGIYVCKEFPDASGKMIHFPAGRIGSDKLTFIKSWLGKNRPITPVGNF